MKSMLYIKVIILLVLFITIGCIEENVTNVHGEKVDLGEMISVRYTSEQCNGCAVRLIERTIIITDKMTIVLGEHISLPNSGKAYYIKDYRSGIKFFSLEGLTECYMMR